MITYIQLKQVARNRRFVIFTILFPIVWYWMMVELINVSSNTKYQLSILVLALLIVVFIFYSPKLVNIQFGNI